MGYIELLHIYLIGIPVWCGIMSLLGEPRDWDYILSAFLWPMMACSLIGQTIRKLFT